MVQLSLVQYLEAQTKRGYDINALRSYLIRYGYDPADIDEAIRYLYQQQQPQVATVESTKKANKVLAYSGIGIFLLLIISASEATAVPIPQMKNPKITVTNTWRYR